MTQTQHLTPTPSRSLSYAVRKRGSGMWTPLNSDWMTESESWVVLHDLFHHLPSDKGSFLDEWRTLGAEYYINHECADPAVPKTRSLSRNAEAVVDLAIEGGAVPDDFKLPAVRCASLSANALEAFASAARHAQRELRMHDFETDPEWAEGMEAFGNVPLLVAHLGAGYHLAKHRFPDQLRAQDAFARGLARLEELADFAQAGDVVTLTLTGYDLTIERTLSNTSLDSPA